MTTAEVMETTEHVESTALTVADEAREIAITNDMEYEAAGLFLRERVKAVLSEANAAFDPIIKKAHAAHKEAVAQKKKACKPLLEAESVVKRLMGDYAAERERERREAEALARRKALAEAERERLEQAAELESAGLQEEAEALIDEPVQAPAAVVDMPKPKAEGISVSKRWEFNILDPSKVKREYLVVDEKKIRKVVRALGAEAVAAVGDGAIEVYEVQDIRARA